MAQPKIIVLDGHRWASRRVIVQEVLPYDRRLKAEGYDHAPRRAVRQRGPRRGRITSTSWSAAGPRCPERPDDLRRDSALCRAYLG